IEAGTHVLDARLLHDLRLWSGRVHHHLRNMQRELDLLLPWMALLREAPGNFTEADPESDVGRVWHELRDLLTTAPDLAEISAISRKAASKVMELRDITDTGPSLLAEWCEDLLKALESGRMSAGTLLIGLRGLAEQAEEMARSMEFGFLFDRQREVYYLGYRVETEELDGNHYDLLASEARTTSLISIANDEIPESHWLHLSRPLTRVNGRRALLSWNGSMFEYLMPELWTRTYEETLLGQTCRAVVECQMEYARSEGVPWGVSESGYYRFDAAMNYQYRGFGVPGLGRKRGLAEDLVITPYASLLALSITPQEVANNVHHLIEVGMRGHYGFYEAVDYTQSRLPLGQERAIVRSYMAHHQGMIMVALVNYLRDQVMVERFHDDARIQSVELLLQEQVPQQVPVEETPEEEVGVLREEERVTLEPWSVSMEAPFPQVHQLSNGNYGLFITEAGGGYSVFTPGESREDKRV
ncbi:MAG: glucoamylase family protein, partial [Anaerolineae bacterium]